MRQIIPAFALCAFLASAPAAAQDAEDVVQYRQSVHQVLKWHFGDIRAMLKGERDYQADRVAAAAGYLQATAQMLPTAYAQDGAITDDSGALPKIWQEWDQFSELLTRLQTETGVLTKIDSSDAEAVTQGVVTIGGVCKDCHDNFKKD